MAFESIASFRLLTMTTCLEKVTLLCHYKQGMVIISTKYGDYKHYGNY